jgi:hypothetical protein
MTVVGDAIEEACAAFENVDFGQIVESMGRSNHDDDLGWRRGRSRLAPTSSTSRPPRRR